MKKPALITILLFSLQVMADEVLIDRICAFSPGEKNSLILKSDVEKLQKSDQISHQDALEKLLSLTALRKHVEELPTFSIKEAQKIASEHIEKIRKQSQLSPHEFSKRLMQEPYNTTIAELKKDTENAIIRDYLQNFYQEKIQVDEHTINEYKKTYNNRKQYLTFITFDDSNEGLILAKKIRQEILKSPDSFLELKRNYLNNQLVTWAEPMKVPQGDLDKVLSKHYVEKIQGKKISNIFKDDKHWTLIWVFHVSESISEENLKKSLKWDLVKKKIDGIAREILDKLLVIINCK